ncbi:TolC family protein [Roseimaritima ulvae]|uniref:Outer membrane efflux protein n=1 Tax=Roseimaritima ulvae TaxID=980254 RepID=A0A5B9QSM2_9BACT|nr:TolC family protein [Roseimaritima ulvae]QEG41994.1 Outer membrane efflux protein [Roseimaritima ulvae]
MVLWLILPTVVCCQPLFAQTVEGPVAPIETLGPGVVNVMPQRLGVADVIASVYASYPEIVQARQRRTQASGDWLAAQGAFDTKLNAHTLSEPTGYYENYRHGIGLARQNWWGGYVSAGYRIGRGDFQPWYKERQTDEGGEFKLAFVQPLLQGRAIDANRVAVFQASLQRSAVEPEIQQALLEISREATAAYWDWVAAGAMVQAQQELLELARERGRKFEAGFQAGKFAEIDVLLNKQLIAERTALTIEAQRKFLQTGFKLSLYLRGDGGNPLVPPADWLPDRFPRIQPLDDNDFATDLAAALSRRPEIRLLELQIQGIQWDRRLAYNQQQPQVDFVAEASQDMGFRATSSDDKDQFELVIGLRGELPLQRRKARGKIQSTSSKINQLNEKLRLSRDKIATNLQITYSDLRLSAQLVDQAETALRLALETLQRYRFAYEQGKIDLIYLNLLETKANEAELKLVKTQQAWFENLSRMQTVLGLDPLDQAMLLSELPPSERIGPGHLPEPQVPNDPPAVE